MDEAGSTSSRSSTPDGAFIGIVTTADLAPARRDPPRHRRPEAAVDARRDPQSLHQPLDRQVLDPIGKAGSRTRLTAMPAPDTQILSRVVMLQTADGAGAGFVVDRRKRKWLVTAAHVVPDDPVLEVDLVFATGRSSTAVTRLQVVPGGQPHGVHAGRRQATSRLTATWSCRTTGYSRARTCTCSATRSWAMAPGGPKPAAALPFVRRVAAWAAR